MKVKFHSSLFIAVFYFIFSSCTTPVEEKIFLSDIKSFLSDSFKTAEWNFDAFECNEPVDTNSANLPFSYPEAIAALQKHFHSIDSLSLSNATKEYAKALIVADFVYAAFSFQFLGPGLGMTTDSTLISGWDSLPLNTCYAIGNSNQASLYCIERTSFYLRLVDTLLNIKGTAVASEVHTFPVLRLASGLYIVDPYDPFIITDSSETRVIDYESLLSKKLNNNFKPKRTKRIFGGTRELISQSFAAELRKQYNNSTCFCCVLQTYLQKNKNYILGFLRPCFDAPAHRFEDIEIINNTKNAYALKMIGRVDGQLDSDEDIIRYYIGIDCKQEK